MRLRSIPIAITLVLAVASGALAQESGGSFGGSSWDDEPSGGGGGSDWGSSGSSGSSDWGSSGSSGSTGGGIDYAEQARQEREREEAARQEAERAAERERQEREAEAERARVERERRLHLPPPARVRDLSWPTTPARPAVASHRVRPVASPPPPRPRIRGSWTTYESPEMAPASVVVQGPPSWLGAGVLTTPIGLGLLVLAYLVTRTPRRRAAPTVAPVRASAPATAMRVSVAFDWTVRAKLQAELAAMAKRIDMRSRSGLAAGAVAIARLLDENLSAARYASWELSTGEARQWFGLRTQDLRARFRAELVRNEAVMRTPEYRAKESEGEGLVVVSVLVAGKEAKQAPPARLDAQALSVAIAGLRPGISDSVLALEVVWSPAAEDDRMSSYELEKLYPELTRLQGGVGARSCAYCRAAFPAELRRCPTCGAPT